MADLQRTNIIELIGKDSRRYHSAILTCYAFDFLFFEERLLPQLRSAGVKNLQVIADAGYVGHQLERTTGKEFRTNKNDAVQVLERLIAKKKVNKDTFWNEANIKQLIDMVGEPLLKDNLTALYLKAFKKLSYEEIINAKDKKTEDLKHRLAQR